MSLFEAVDNVFKKDSILTEDSPVAFDKYAELSRLHDDDEDDGFLSDEAHELADIVGDMEYSGDYYSMDEWNGCTSDKPNDIYKYHDDLERPLVKDFLAKYKDEVLANWNDFFQAMENDNRHTALHLIAKELGKEESEELTEGLDIEDMKTETMQSIDNFLGTVIDEVESDVFVQYINSIIDLAKSYLPNESEK